MNRREFVYKLGTGTCATTLLSGSKDVNGTEPKDERPNIIFIFADDMGWGDMPCYGHRNVIAHGGWTVRGELKMPNFDRMANEGTLFTQFYVSSAVCSPSRAGIMTGQFPSRLGIHDYLATPELNRERGMPDFLDPSVPTVTRLLKDAGYRTGHFGKWHLGGGKDAPKPEDYGIDRYSNCLRGPGRRPGSTEMIIDETLDFITSNKDTPFYINAWLYDPHSPLHPTEEQLELYDELSPRWGEHKGALQVWYAVLSNIDRQVGRLLDKLDTLGLSENTIVVFSSDNGPEIGLIPFTSHYAGVYNAGPFRGVKRSLYEGGVRMPFIVRWPGSTPSGRVDSNSILSAADLLPTFCNLAGVTPPGGTDLDGEDISGALLGKSLKRNKILMWENRFPVYGHVIDKSPMLAIRDGDWKLLMNPDQNRVELFNIPDDPTELNNLAHRYPDVVKRLSGPVLKWQKTLPDGPVHKDAGTNFYPWPR